MSGLGRCRNMRAIQRELEERAQKIVEENLPEPDFLKRFISSVRGWIPEKPCDQIMCPPILQKMEDAAIQVKKPYKVSIVLVPFLFSNSVVHLLDQIIHKTNCKDIHVEIIILDNSNDESEQKVIEDKCNSITKFKTKYIHNEQNLKLANSLNCVADYCDSDFIVYLCSKDVYIYHKDWLKHMVDELMKYNSCGSVVMAGQMYGFDQGYDDLPMNMHIQGGIYITYTKFFKNNKYEGILFPHVFMDVIYCRKLIKSKYHFINLPKVRSFAGDGWSKVDHSKNLKSHEFYIVHAHECKDYLLED